MATSTEPPSEVNGRNSESAVMTYQVPQFDETKDKWTSYIIRIESYFEGNGIMDDVKKRALLVSALGSRAIDILSGRCAPRKVKELTYSQAIEILEEFYAPRPNEIAESFKFFMRVQKEEESAQQFIVELRQLADKCNFGDMLDRMLRDKIVCGIRNIDVQKALLSRPKLTLQETENIVLAAEAARQGVKLMKPSDVKSEPELHKLAAAPAQPDAAEDEAVPAVRRSTRPKKPVTGSSGSAVCIWHLSDVLGHASKTTWIEAFTVGSNFPRNLALVDCFGTMSLLVVTNEGRLLRWILSGRELSMEALLQRDYLVSYSVLSVSPRRNYFAVGSIKGHILVFKCTDTCLRPHRLLGFNSPVSHEGAGIGRPLRRPRPAPVEHDRMEVLTEQEQDQCADAPSHDVQEGAVKFGDSVHSYVRLHDVVHFKADFNLSLDIRTYYPNGILVLAQNPGHNRHLALLLSGGRVKLEVAERSPKKLVSHGNLNNGQWHHVHLSKEGSRISLEVDDKPALKLQVHKRLPFRGPLHVGGIAKGVSVPEELKRESFKGCIRNFNLNGQMVDLAKGESRGIGVCFATIEPGALFEGDAYAVYGERFNVNDKLDVRLEFRTWRLNGVLLSLSKQPHGTPALAVELHEGEVIVSVDLGHNGTGPFRARKKFSSKQAMCDGQWHTLVVHVSRSEVSLRVDRHQAAYGLAPATPPEPHMESPLYIGGLPEGSTNGALFGRDNFVGCLRNVAVNDKRVEWIDMASLHNVLPNSCPAA
ncbi:laminin subunit alpha-1 [Ixodes scapularis]